MADEIKGSLLPPAATVSKDDFTFIIQGGVTKKALIEKVTGNNTQHMVIDLAGLGGGGDKPAFSQIGSTAFHKLTFDSTDVAFFQTDLPHDMDYGQDIQVHITWACDGAEGSDVIDWEIEYAVTDYVGGNAATASGVVVTGTEYTCHATANTLAHDTSIAVPESAISLGSILGIKLRRGATTATPAPAADPYILLLHLEYQSDKLGT